MNKSIKKIYCVAILAYIIIFIVSLFIGRYIIRFENIINFSNIELQLEKNIIFNLRLPRAIMASLAGISLSLSGLIYQETFQNDLVSPDLLGVSQGAGVGAAIAIVFSLSNVYIAIFSFIFGIITVICTVLVSNIFKNKSNITLILSGIIVGGFMSSILTSIKYFVDPETKLSTIVYWLMGSFKNVTYDNIVFIFPIVLFFLTLLILISHRINLIALGKEETETKGINYILYRNIIIITATILTSIIVSFCGTISWIGLIIPHIVKSIIGRDANKTIPLCAIFGSTFSLITDILSRSITQSEIPISAITGILGSVIFTIILINRNNEKYNFNIKYNSNEDATNVLIKEPQIISNDSINKNTIIKLENVYFKYNNKMNYVLNNVSININKNDIILLYGLNGSGKTTLIKIVLGILKPTSGNVFYGEKNINDLSMKSRSKIISYVKQDFTNTSNIIVKDYLILGMVNELKFYEKPTSEQISRVERYAKEFSITRLLDKKFCEISGGEKQLVAICQSLLQDSDVLIMDEPTSSLDTDNQKLVIGILVKLSKQYNKTIIFSTHNIMHKNINNCKILRIN